MVTQLRHHMSEMENIPQLDQFDFHNPAEVYVAKGGRQGRRVEYRRFQNGAEAVRFLMEDVEPASLVGSVIETDAGRFDANLIRRLYVSPAYPLGTATTSATLPIVH